MPSSRRSASAGSGATGGPGGFSLRWWVVALLGALPQILLAMGVLLSGHDSSGDEDKMRSQLELLAAVVFLFWSLVGCGGLALWSQMRPLASALAWGAVVGFFLTGFVSCAVH